MAEGLVMVNVEEWRERFQAITGMSRRQAVDSSLYQLGWPMQGCRRLNSFLKNSEKQIPCRAEGRA
jgi:hypothetical protein